MKPLETAGIFFTVATLLLRPTLSAQQLPLGADRVGLDEKNGWTASTERFSPNQYQRRPYVSNGYFGQNLPIEGVGYWVDQNETSGDSALNGWPLDQPRATFGTVSGFWGLIPKVTRPILDENVRRGWESVISGIPDWTGLVVSWQSEHYRPGVDPNTVERYRQTQDFRTGIVHTNITWRPGGREAPLKLGLNFTVLAHRSIKTLGIVRLDVVSSQNTTVSITDVLDGAAATRSVPGPRAFEDGTLIWTSVRPHGIGNITAFQASSVIFDGPRCDDKLVQLSRENAKGKPWISPNASTVAQSWALELQKGVPVSIFKYVGIVSTESFPGPTGASVKAKETALKARSRPWDLLISQHKKAWDEAWDGIDIVLPGNDNLTVLTRASLFHLMTNLRPESEDSLMVGGLASDSYAGLIFWDSETWMYPSVLLMRPEYALSINRYRKRRLRQAQKNAQLYGYSGALYPWTSARYGNCTGTGLCQHYQYHLNTEIALAQWQYYLQTGNISWLGEEGWPVIREVAHMFAAFVRKNESRQGQYETIRMGEPDEYVWNVNNGAFTNAGIKQLLGEWAPMAANELEIETPTNWSTIAENIVIPYDAKEALIHEYDNMPGTTEIKQASVALINYPLQYRRSTRQAENDLEYYSGLTSPNGPAMTWSIYAISAAQLQHSGCAAYTYLTRSYEPYLRAPFYQFSEQINDDPRANGGISPAFPFLTGHGGFLQALTHGLTGFRSHRDAVILDPMLPPQLPGGLFIRRVKWRGATFDIDIKLENSTITRGFDTGTGAPEFLPIQVKGPRTRQTDYRLRVGDTAIVSTRRPDLSLPVIPGNLAQCSFATSTTPHVPGHGPLAAVDGSPATIWQPTDSSIAAELVIDLQRQIYVGGFHILWGNVPPESFDVYIAGSLKEGFDTFFTTRKVKISNPYEGPEEAREVKRRPGNSTSYTAPEGKPNVQFVKLVVFGTQGNEKGLGPTVAEFAIL